MTTYDEDGARGTRAPRATGGYARSGTGRSIDDVRRRGREAQSATLGANALALTPQESAPPRTRATTARNAAATTARNAAAETTRGSAARATTATRATAATRDSATTARAATTIGAATATRGTAATTTRGTAATTTRGGTSGATDARAQVRASITVAPPAPVSAPRAPFVALVLAVVALGVLGILVINTKINENQFQLHDLRTQQNTLDQEEQRLKREIAERDTPNSLAKAAEFNGLVQASTPAYLRLPDGRQIGVPRPASGPGDAATGAASAAPARGADAAGAPASGAAASAASTAPAG